MSGASFYGFVLRALGDRRFIVENVATGKMVHCRLKGSMRRGEFVKADDWVLCSMRDYESDTEHHDRKAEIVLKYTAPQVRQLSRAGELPEREAKLHQMSNVAFVDDWTPEDGSCPLQRRDAPKLGNESDEDDESDEEESNHQFDPDAVRVLCEQANDLPSPTFTKKSRSRHSRPSPDCVLQVDFHHSVDFEPCCPNPVARPTPARLVAPIAPPAPTSVTIRARVKFWDAAKGIGYATPEDKSQTRGGVDVKLTAECVAGLKRPLLRDDVVEITIDPRHDRPYVLGGGLSKVG